MEKKFDRYMVTAALIYANGPVHIGHLAGAYIPADIYVRYLRSQEKEVVFVSGTDEHGVPITIKARNENKTPQEVVDIYYEMIKKSFYEFGISFDIYARTSNPIHHRISEDFFMNLYKKDAFEEKVTEQYYDTVAKQFLADRYIVGTCPHCKNENAYGDQCEKCGSTLSPSDLLNPRSTLSGEKPILQKTKNWYLPLEKYQKSIEAYLESHKEWKINVFGQCKSWLTQGLQSRSMTRDLEWGVKVPLPDAEGKVLYVWFDAPIGYISATKELIPNDWEKYWKDTKTKLVHFIGKDNIVFHTIIFPAMLMEHGQYILPDNVPANEFMNLEGQKISTSRNWAVWLHEYLIDFKGKEDVLRYMLTANAPETKDSDFSWKDFQTKNNSELVGIFGNFVNRTLVLVHKYFEGVVPHTEKLQEKDTEVLLSLQKLISQIEESIENFKFRDALSFFMDIARLGNKYLAETEPWKLINTDEERVKTVLHVAVQITAVLQITSEPFIPKASFRISEMLAISPKKWIHLKNIPDLIKAGHIINPSSILFEKIEDETIEKQLQKLELSKKNNIYPTQNTFVTPIKPSIKYEEFEKMDIRIATVLECEKVPKSEKLLRFLLDTGLDKRTVVSGIAAYYNPSELIGKQVILLANLSPRKIMGIESRGMILSAEDQNKILTLIQPKIETTAGATIG
ncbi:MAG: methionine--tRNA ligase [Chitinophagaceae bacterium]|nr:methionine--tRNA ligase [Chitinophagaceae bacterium]